MHESEQLIRSARGRAHAATCSNRTRAVLSPPSNRSSRHKPFFTGKVSETMLNAYLAQGRGADGVLTTRERSVVQLIAEGRSNKDVRQILGLSLKTVETHRASAMRKVGVNSTAGMVRYAIRNQIVELEGAHRARKPRASDLWGCARGTSDEKMPDVEGVPPARGS